MWVRIEAVLVALHLTALLLVAPAPAEELYVTITRPTPGQPVFGEVDFEVRAGPLEQIDRLELFVDGNFAGSPEAPPFRVRIDVGSENVEHRFEAVVRGHSGSSRDALLVTPALRIDEEVDLELQQLYVTVTRGGERILDLERGDFTVLDQGRPQELVTFERGDVPLVALLMVDASASMQGRPLETALRGAETFVDGMRPLDRAKLLLFSDRIVHTTPFTGFAEVLTTGLQTVSAEGGTALNDHLYLALKLLEERQGRRVIVLLTDGVDVASVLGMRDVEWVARRSQALVYWIRLGDPGARHTSAWRDVDGHREELERLEDLVASTGGRIHVLESMEETETAFAGILRELREQYVLGYYPNRNRNDGSWHKVRIRLDKPGFSVRTREGYLDD